MFPVVLRILFALLICLAFQVPDRCFAAAEDHGHAAAEAHGDGGHGEGGHGAELPMNWKTDLALFSLVTFGVYVLVLKAGAWGPLQQGLNERERGIRQNIADAEANRLKSESMLKEYDAKLAKVQEEVRDILAEARRDAEHTKQDIVASAQREAEATKNRAIAEIELSRDQALKELFEFVSTNVIGATEKVIGRSLSDSDHERLVSDALAQMNVRRN